MTRTLEILYVGTRHRDELEDIVNRGAVIHDADNVYEGIAQLKRNRVGAALVEMDALRPAPERAVEALRAAAGRRPVLVSMNTDEWEDVRPFGFLDLEDVLLRPFYPDELWRRVTRAALPLPSKAASRFRSDADRLTALLSDAQRLNRFTNDLQAMAEHCVGIVKARLRAGRVSLFLKTRQQGVLSVVDAAGLPESVRKEAILRLGEGVAGEIAQRKRVVLVQEAGRDGPASDDRSYAASSYLVAPLLHEPDVVGVVCATERLERGPFTAKDLAYMESFAEVAGQIVHNALQYRAADRLSFIDEGTGLYNRRYFNRVLSQEVVRAQRYKHDLTLALMDIDHFKRYNDTNGHQAGDAALAKVASILKDSFRQADIVVRYGGEEFAIIMPETSRKEGNGVGFVDRARRRVEEAGLMFRDERGVERALTISGGVATLPLQAENAEDLFARADEALYKAKARGRNVIVGY